MSKNSVSRVNSAVSWDHLFSGSRKRLEKSKKLDSDMPGQSDLSNSFQRSTITLHPTGCLFSEKAFSKLLTRFEFFWTLALTSNSKTEHFFVSRLDTSLEKSLSKILNAFLTKHPSSLQHNHQATTLDRQEIQSTETSQRRKQNHKTQNTIRVKNQFSMNME